MSNRTEPTILHRSEKIREKVDHRHWDLFESRLKTSKTLSDKENYTKTNDYRIVTTFDKSSRPTEPIEPNRRWNKFCHQLTEQSNETDRLMSMFHNVWKTNWNREQTAETMKRRMTQPDLDENSFLNKLQSNEHDRKVVSNILKRTKSSEGFLSA